MSCPRGQSLASSTQLPPVDNWSSKNPTNKTGGGPGELVARYLEVEEAPSIVCLDGSYCDAARIDNSVDLS